MTAEELPRSECPATRVVMDSAGVERWRVHCSHGAGHLGSHSGWYERPTWVSWSDPPVALREDMTVTFDTPNGPKEGHLICRRWGRWDVDTGQGVVRLRSSDLTVRRHPATESDPS